MTARHPTMRDVRLGVMDLGSSSFQLLVADVDAGPEPEITPVRRTREVLNLGLASASSATIPEPLLEEALATLRSFRRIAASNGAEHVLAIATSALREAEDRHGLSAALGDAAGVPIRFLSGDEEATLMYAGIRGSVGGANPLLALDLGGGSLELAIGEGPMPSVVASAPLGAARLTGALGNIDRLGDQDRARAEDVIAAALGDPHLDAALGQPAEITAACGGTVRTLARIAQLEGAPSTHAPGTTLRRSALEELTFRLWEMPLADRLAVPGIAKRRAAILPAGALVLLRTLERAGSEAVIVSGWGLREGCLLEATRADAA